LAIRSDSNHQRPEPDPAAQLRELAAACALGDRAAFDRLHARFSRGLLAFFTKRGASHAADAEELAQRAWMGVWSALSAGRYDPERAAISTFIYAVASKTWLQHLRQQGGFGSDNAGLDESMEELAADAEGTIDEVAAAEQLEAVRKFLRERGNDEALSDDEHQIIVAAAGGASDRELAARFSLAPSTVNAKKQAGWGKVRRFLARLGHRPEQAERTESARE
jgi:RNA polymerase sigma-70 factor (ECF subfamily)